MNKQGKMKSRYLYATGVVLVVLVAGIFVFTGESDTMIEDLKNPRGLEDFEKASGEEEILIQITSAGFIPDEVTIKKGETVLFVNIDNKVHWPAGDDHPSHENYPGSSIGHCDGSKKDYIFDSCKGLKQYESFSFTFNETGKWGYHDHIRTSETGVIIVE